MSRLNLTLSDDTFSKLERVARLKKMRVASYTKQLIEEALEAHERLAWNRKLAADYAADRKDAKELLSQMELAQFEVVDK